MGSIGTQNTVKTEPWSHVYNAYRKQIEYSTELDINPDNGHAYFSANEAPVTPIIDNFIGNIVGTDEQIRKYYEDLYPHKMVSISRSKYW